MQFGESGYEQPSRPDRCLGYGPTGAARHGRGYREREAARWLDRLHARPGTVGEYDIVIVPFAFYLFRPLGTEAAIKRFENWITSHERQIAAAVALLAGGYMVISGLVRVI